MRAEDLRFDQQQPGWVRADRPRSGRNTSAREAAWPSQNGTSIDPRSFKVLPVESSEKPKAIVAQHPPYMRGTSRRESRALPCIAC